MGEKITDKIKYFMGVDSEEDEVIENTSVNEDFSSSNRFVQGNLNDDKEELNIVKPKPVKKKVYDISSNRMKVVVHRPTKFEESEKIVRHLLENKPVILNLSQLEEGITNKVFNFCSGALCALEGHMIKVDSGIFLLAPSNIDVSGDIKEELESKGMFSW